MPESDDRRHSTSPLSSISSTGDDQEGRDRPSDLITPIRFFPISKAELSLPAVLKCGQTFRWNRSQLVLKLSPDTDSTGGHQDQKVEVHDEAMSSNPNPHSEFVEWSMAWIDRTIVLRQDDKGIHYTALYRPCQIKEYDNDCKLDTTYSLLRAYFVLDVSLVSLYQDWSERDPVFSSKVSSGEWDGLRVVRQDAWETLISFICSANNNIPRISLMLNRLCAAFGNLMPRPPLGVTLSSKLERQNVESNDPSSLRLELHSFPSPTRLSQADVIEKLKLLGFGYRAGYVHHTSIKLCEIALQAQKENHWPGFPNLDCNSTCKNDEQQPGLLKTTSFEPQGFLDFLASQTYDCAHSKLVNQFPGVGPKVGDCICLFGLGFVHVVPVDIHIYKIALRDYQLDLSSPKKSATPTRSITKNHKQTVVDQPSSSRKAKASPSSKTLAKIKPDLAKQLPSKLIPIKKPKSFNPSSVPPTLTRPNYLKIQNFFLSTWGPWAGWAQQILFLADLTKAPT